MVCNTSISLKPYVLSCFVLGLILVFLLRHSNTFNKKSNRFVPCYIPTLTFTYNYLMQEVPSKRNMNANVINDTCKPTICNMCDYVFQL